MTATLSGPSIADYKRIIREKLKAEVHQPVPEELITQVISAINKESDVLLSDAGCVIALSLIENGHNPDKIFVAEGLNGEYKVLAEKLSSIYGFHHIGLNVDKISSIMKFDYILGNPPFQSENGGGSLRGSGSSALYLDIVKNSLQLLNPGGEIRFITPVNIFSGGDEYRNLFLGSSSQYDVISVNFNTNKYFPGVGCEMCQWNVRNTSNANFLTVVDGIRKVNLKQRYFLTADQKFDDIVHSISSSNLKKLEFNTKNRYDFVPVRNYIKKNNLNVSEKFQESADDTYKYPVNVNGKIKYSAVKWKDIGVWRIFLPWMPPKGLAVFEISNEWSASPSTLTMKFNTEEECRSAYEILNTPEYRWIISRTIKNGRVNPAIINLLPVAPLSEVLSEDQLDYIQSQL
jgi:hypothetical protein